MQIKNTFDVESVKKIGSNALIIGGCAAGTAIIQYLSGQNFGDYQPLIMFLLAMAAKVIEHYNRGV